MINDCPPKVPPRYCHLHQKSSVGWQKTTTLLPPPTGTFSRRKQLIGWDGIKRGERNEALLGSHKGDEAIRVVLLLAGLTIERWGNQP